MSGAKTESGKKSLVIRIIAAAVLIGALLLSLVWTDWINRRLGLVKTVDGEYDGLNPEEALAPGTETEGVGGDLNVHFVDVGQGDACIIEFPDERNMLIDAGDTKSKNKKKLLDYIEENINDGEGNDIAYFDFVILTHPDSDHCGGMGDVLAKYPAKTFYRPNVYTEDKNTEDNFSDPETGIRELGKNNIKNTAAYYNAIKGGYNPDRINGIESTVIISDAANESISLIEPEGVEKDSPDYYSFTFYAPVVKSYRDNNNYSPVMILEYHGKRFMLSGDAEEEAEADFVKAAKAGEGKYAIFDDAFTVDVFKLGHHGSSTSSSEDFINVMTTEENCPNVIAVVSCGEGNSYGHPHKEVLDRLIRLGFSESNIVRTDVNGTIAMSVRATCDEEGNPIFENGRAVYELRMGAETVRRSEAAVGNDAVQLTWREIVIVAIILIIAVFFILPVIYKSKYVKKQVRQRGSVGR